jgi:CDP-diacylglycerol--glycerol-3-phosphate 3-phosphatidyltransferase/cardiolipin synthase
VSFPIANYLTVARIVMIPLVVILFYAPYPWAAPACGTMFILAAVTDSLDGYLARKLGQTSALGAFLDPVADKLMVVAALIMLVWLDRAEPWLAIIIIGREIAVSALREWMAQIGKSKSVAVAFIGKVKTVAQITAVIALLLYQPVIPGIDTKLLGKIALWVAAVLTLWSMFHYLRLAAPHFSPGPGSPRDPPL